MTLDQFLEVNRTEIIRRTRTKVASRSAPAADPEELEHGVPLFLSQLSETLKGEVLSGPDQAARSTHDSSAISESAARHGKDLLKFGFTIEQVVHDYGDVCQAVTELAEERGSTLSIAEFHTLNRCLDNAIAGAVASWTHERDRTSAHELERTDKTAGTLRDLGKLVEKAQALAEVISQGRVGGGGATGTLLLRVLAQTRALIDEAEGT